MKLYYHRTDGGAEYYCAEYILGQNGHKEGKTGTALLRTDGGEIEIFTEQLKRLNIKLVLNLTY